MCGMFRKQCVTPCHCSLGSEREVARFETCLCGDLDCCAEENLLIQWALGDWGQCLCSDSVCGV